MTAATPAPPPPSPPSPPSPLAPTVVLRCPSGFAGNMWLAAAMALGADPASLRAVPRRLAARTTATGAALLRGWCSAHQPATEATVRCAVSSTFVRRYQLSPLSVALHPAPRPTTPAIPASLGAPR